MIVNNDKSYTFSADLSRNDVSKYFKKESLQQTGFQQKLPISFFKDVGLLDYYLYLNIRFFALTKEGAAGELPYFKSYRWN